MQYILRSDDADANDPDTTFMEIEYVAYNYGMPFHHTCKYSQDQSRGFSMVSTKRFTLQKFSIGIFKPTLLMCFAYQIINLNRTYQRNSCFDSLELQCLVHFEYIPSNLKNRYFESSIIHLKDNFSFIE